MKEIIIFGGTGFIGKHLVNELKADYKLFILTRNTLKVSSDDNTNVIYRSYNPDQPEELVPLFEKAFGIINLAGQNIGEKRWSKQFKDNILQSRIKIGTLIADVFDRCKNKPSFFIQGSATHYYGIQPTDDPITENQPGSNDCFLTRVSVKAEENVKHLNDHTRLIFIRTGIVLDKREGAFTKMAMPIKYFVGGPLGNGEQWVPWIHITDEVRAIRFIIENTNLVGGVNLTAPHPVKQKDFAKTIGHKIHRPAFIPAPAFALRIILGKMRADELLLSGLNIVPEKLLKAGFKFQSETIEKALSEIY